MARINAMFTITALAGCLLVSACGGGDSSGSADSQQAAPDAKVIDADAIDTAKGTVTFCTGKDTSGYLKRSLADFNARFGDAGLRAKLLEFPEAVEQQRTQFIQRQQAKSGECDVFNADVVWTAELASQNWLYDMSPYVEAVEKKFVPSTLASLRYADRYWGVPFATDSALLYYRTDQVDGPPSTWQELYRSAAATDGLVTPGMPYEGLTCSFLELAFAAGGRVLSDDGTRAVLDSPENREALQLMVDGLADGALPAAVTTYDEEQSRRLWEAGKATYMRNWPYAYALGQQADPIKGKFTAAPLPAWDGGEAASILGGQNLVVSAYSENPTAALKLIDFMTSEDNERTGFIEFSTAPTVSTVYDDPAVREQIPFAAELRRAVEQAHARPVSPVYPQISQAIYNNVNAALAGRTSPAEALARAQEQVQKALETF